MQINRIRTREEKIAILDKALEEGLYSPRGIFANLFPYLKEKTSYVDISIAQIEESLIGIALYFKEYEDGYHIEKGTISLYVKPEHRRQKVGTKLVETFKWKKFRRAYLGAEGSEQFFESNKIEADWY